MTVSDDQNQIATERLRRHLATEGLTIFPVTGCSPDLRHQEPGFGIVVDDHDVIINLGREWLQEAIFWIEDGTVHLVSCSDAEVVNLGEWAALVWHPAQSRQPMQLSQPPGGFQTAQPRLAAPPGHALAQG